MTTLLNLDPNLQISTSRALTEIIQERNNLYQLKENKDFLIKILNSRFESQKIFLDLQKETGLAINIPSFIEDSLNLSDLSPSEFENVLSTCTLEQTHLGLQLICPPEIYKNYISPNSLGIVFSIDFEGKQNQIVCVSSESFDRSEPIIEHESFHVIFNHIMNERKKRDSLGIFPDIPKEKDLNNLTTIESFIINSLEEINSGFLNELFAHTVNFKTDSKTINRMVVVLEEHREKAYKIFLVNKKKF